MFQAKHVQNGNTLDYTPQVDLAAGSVVARNSLIGVTSRMLPAGVLGSITVAGVFDVVKANLQINDGALVYWDDAAKQATTNAGGNTFLGFALGVAAAEDATVRVLLTPVSNIANTIHNPLSAIIADPGDTGAIPVVNTGSCAIVTAGAETRTLADPTGVGQMLSLTLKTDGGDCGVTVANAVNQAGNTLITFGDVGDSIVLVAVDVGGNVRWRVLSSDGVVLSTP